MTRITKALSAAVLLIIVTLGFSGCKGDATSVGAVGKSDSLTNEPDVAFKDLQGNDVKLSSFKGKVVLVNFWGTWCEPCRGEIPILISLQQKYGPKGFTLLGVATNDEEKTVDAFIHNTQFNVGGQQMTMNYPVVMGSDDISTKFGGLIGMPTSFLITRDGKIFKRYIGALTESQIVKDVESQL
jgi:cytochrome c biogenesis protein CcmG, thiol:disulfide interchange protein DsbE